MTVAVLVPALVLAPVPATVLVVALPATPVVIVAVVLAHPVPEGLVVPVVRLVPAVRGVPTRRRVPATRHDPPGALDPDRSGVVRSRDVAVLRVHRERGTGGGVVVTRLGRESAEIFWHCGAS
jgi:hypothetical protein